MRNRAPLGLVCLLACGNSGTPFYAAIGEPITVNGAQFVPGSLPGTPPVDGGSVMDNGFDAGSNEPLEVTYLESPNPLAIPGAAGKSFSGRVTQSAVAVGMRFPDLGTGYWVTPLGAPDPEFPGELTWSVSMSFNSNIPTGFHDLRFTALDGNGNASPQADIEICAASRIPDNHNSCYPNIAPPSAVFTLMWDADVDLDLQVTTPDGRVVDPKHPATVDPDGGAVPANAGVIDRDSLANCVPDGLRQEDLVFQQPPSGTYQIAVNLFSACNKAGTTFTVIVNQAAGTVPNSHLQQTFRRGGEMQGFEANGGLSPGLFFVSYPFGG
jgi:hypothetical protein